MAKNEGLLSILQEVKDSKRNTDWENIELFADFLNRRYYRKILEFSPQIDELIVAISFDECNEPHVKLSDVITLHGELMFPFNQDFVESVAADLHNLEGTEDDIGIKVVMPTEDNPRHYEFLSYVSDDTEGSKETETSTNEEATQKAAEKTHEVFEDR